MNVKRAYQYRFYPTPEQADLLARTFGCARFVYNALLRWRTEVWHQRQERVGYGDTSAALTALKKDSNHRWLNDVSCVPLQQALRHLQNAFSNFFQGRAQYPTFRCRHDRQSAEYTASAFRFDGRALRLAKMSEPLAVRWSKQIPTGARVTTVTVSKDRAGRYFVSLLCDDAIVAKPDVAGKVGIDLGLTHFATLSSGEKIVAPNIFRKQEAKLVKLQRRLVKKKKGSANREKARRKVARLHAHITDSRKDFLHKLSSRLVHENQVIAVETLAVQNMQKNHRLAKSIADAGWSEFIRQLRYKSRWYGRKLVSIDQWYPSTKRCAVCGFVLAKVSLQVRTWCCPACGTMHDRDVNAARNVLAAGLAASALGEYVSPACS